jgi:hypothetical protein
MTSDHGQQGPAPGQAAGNPPGGERLGGDGLLRVLSVNWLTGGVDRDTGSTRRQRTIIEAAARCHPHVVLCQEITAGAGSGVHRQVWHIANQLGMTALLGPEGGISGNHPAILVKTGQGLRIIDAGPPPHPPGTAPSWCEALIKIPGLDRLVAFYSVHLPPRSSAAQLHQAHELASRITQNGAHAIAGGDWNSYGRGDQITAEALAAQPKHLRTARMRRQPDGQFTPNYDVHDTLTAAGMADAAVEVPAGARDPHELRPTGINGGGRVDRIYLTSELAPAAWGYAQWDTGGSDHEAVMILLDLSQVTAAPPGPYL